MMKPMHVARLALVAQAFVWWPAMAQNRLTVTTELASLSNPGLAEVDPGSVTVIRVNPQYTIRREEGSVVTEFAFGALVERSNRTDLSADRELPRASVLWQNSSAVSVFEVNASLEEASTRETEFAEFGRVTLDSTSRTGQIGTRWTRDLTPASSIDIAAAYRQVNYDSSALVEYAEVLASAAYLFRPSETTTYSLAGDVSRLNPDGTTPSASRAGLLLGYEREITPEQRVNANVGVVRVNLPQKKTYAVGGLRFSHAGERLGYSLGWSRNVGASGAIGGYERSETYDAAMTYPLTELSSLAVGATRSRSLEAARDAGSSVYARVRSELTQFWALTFGLEFRRSEPSGRPSARGHSAVVGLVYENPDF